MTPQENMAQAQKLSLQFKRDTTNLFFGKFRADIFVLYSNIKLVSGHIRSMENEIVNEYNKLKCFKKQDSLFTPEQEKLITKTFGADAMAKFDEVFVIKEMIKKNKAILKTLVRKQIDNKRMLGVMTFTYFILRVFHPTINAAIPYTYLGIEVLLLLLIQFLKQK